MDHPVRRRRQRVVGVGLSVSPGCVKLNIMNLRVDMKS